MSRELLKQALYALKYHSIQTRPIDLTNETIEALRQELAKPEPRKEWVGLTDEDIEEAWGNTPLMLNARDGGARKVFALAIQAKIKEKNNA